MSKGRLPNLLLVFHSLRPSPTRREPPTAQALAHPDLPGGKATCRTALASIRVIPIVISISLKLAFVRLHIPSTGGAWGGQGCVLVVPSSGGEVRGKR